VAEKEEDLQLNEQTVKDYFSCVSKVDMNQAEKDQCLLKFFQKYKLSMLRHIEKEETKKIRRRNWQL
jgi:hypothetical protein